MKLARLLTATVVLLVFSAPTYSDSVKDYIKWGTYTMVDVLSKDGMCDISSHKQVMISDNEFDQVVKNTNSSDGQPGSITNRACPDSIRNYNLVKGDLVLSFQTILDPKGNKVFKIAFEPPLLVLGRKLSKHKGVSQYTQLKQILPTGEVKSLPPRIYTTTTKESNQSLQGPNGNSWKDCVFSDITEDNAGTGFGLLYCKDVGPTVIHARKSKRLLVRQ